MAFAVGMVVDNAIVVLENIFRHRQMGEGRWEAARKGTEEVWGAILASTLTTVAVFLPVIFIQEEVGQLFKDIAVAVSCAVILSLLVAITAIPTMAARYLRIPPSRLSFAEGPNAGSQTVSGKRRRLGLDNFGRGVALSFGRIFNWGTKSVARRVLIVVIMTGLSIGTALLLMPKVEYLPEGNRNMLYGFLIPPPGYNTDELMRVGSQIEHYLQPYFERDGQGAADDGVPVISKYFYVATPRFVFSGGSADEPERVRELIPVIKSAFNKIPGLIGVVQQASIFRSGSEPRSIDIEIMGPELVRLLELGGGMFGQILQGMPGSQVRPIPSLDLGEPEVRITPDRNRAASLGLTASQIGESVAAMVDGVVVSDYWHRGDKIDLVLLGRGGRPNRIQDLETMELRAPGGERVTLGDVARVELVSGPKQINHVERVRAIVLRVIPPDEMPLQAAMEWLQGEVIDPLRDAGEIGGPYQIRLAGTADKLTETWKALKWNFILALVICFLLMASLFESFLYPLVILFSVPLATAGGFLGLFAVNHLIAYQPLDVLTMLGFIILIGIVVNNAILVVHQSLLDMREEGLAPREAINGAILKRVRPIFMSTTTSVFGMMPLVLFPGAGSELYRGLGSVVVGGLAVSTLFTLILVPAVLSLVLGARGAVKRLTDRVGKSEREEGKPVKKHVAHEGAKEG
jgi:HAE1 family hydrophobic/amphiphilic exporter-1